MKLGNSWKRYDKEVGKLLESYSSLTKAQLEFLSVKSDWNLYQVLEHLYYVEYVTFNAIQERAGLGIKKKSAFRHQKRYYQLAFALILPAKYKVPKEVVNAEKPEINGDLSNLWKIHHSHLGDYIHSLPQTDKKVLLFKHPIAGPFNIMQTLGFLYYHLKHHHNQLNAIKKDSNFPSS
jgi:hypothetical protein